MYKEIKDFPNYSINCQGHILNTKRGSSLKPYFNNQGYPVVQLSKDGKVYNKSVHRLVAETFLDNPDNKPQVNHIDGNRSNYSYMNLEWVTNQENVTHGNNRRNNSKVSKKKIMKLYKQGQYKQIEDFLVAIMSL